MHPLRHRLLTAIFVFAAITLYPIAQAGELKLALANSTCAAMKKVGQIYVSSRPVELTFICKSSGLLAKGLGGGLVSADIFISANRKWMDFVVAKGLVDTDQVSTPWGNTLVVATPASGSIVHLDWQDLASDKVTKVLIGDPSTAPFGRHAKEALESTGLWESVRGKIETRKNIELLAESLGRASTGTVGILFKTNLTGQLRELLTVNVGFHKPIRYYVAPLKTAEQNPDVTDFLAFMKSPAATKIFAAEGYSVNMP